MNFSAYHNINHTPFFDDLNNPTPYWLLARCCSVTQNVFVLYSIHIWLSVHQIYENMWEEWFIGCFDVYFCTDNCYNKVKKSTKFQSNAGIFDGNMTSSNVDLMSDNLRRNDSVTRDYFILKLCHFCITLISTYMNKFSSILGLNFLKFG